MPIRASTLTGAAGEHYVAYRLSRLGYAVGLMRAGSPGVDLVVSHPTTGAAASVQVKTAEAAFAQKKNGDDKRWGWWVTDETGTRTGENLFYALVSLTDQHGDPVPVVFIVPAAIVAEGIKSPTSQWSKGWFGFFEPEAQQWRDKNGEDILAKKLGRVTTE